MKFNSHHLTLFAGAMSTSICLLLIGSSVARAGDQAETKTHSDISAVTPDTDNNKSGPADAFPGVGQVDNTGVPQPGKYEINLSLNRAFGKARPTDTTGTIEFNYGFEFYRDFQIGCEVPYVVETGKNDNGSSYRESGGSTPSCGAKVLFYEDDKTGISASIAVNYQRAKSIMFGNFSGNPLENHVIVPVVVQKDLIDGKISLLGTVIFDHTIPAGLPILHRNQMTFGAGAGYRINDDRSLSVDATKTIQGVAWVEVVYMQRSQLLTEKIGRDTFAYVKVGKSSNGSYADSNQKIVEVGLQINGKAQHGMKGGIFHEIVEAKDNADARAKEDAKSAADLSAKDKLKSQTKDAK